MKAVVKGLGELTGKTLSDATNPIGSDFQLAADKDNSGAEDDRTILQLAEFYVLPIMDAETNYRLQWGEST